MLSYRWRKGQIQERTGRFGYSSSDFDCGPNALFAFSLDDMAHICHEKDGGTDRLCRHLLRWHRRLPEVYRLREGGRMCCLAGESRSLRFLFSQDEFESSPIPAFVRQRNTTGQGAAGAPLLQPPKTAVYAAFRVGLDMLQSKHLPPLAAGASQLSIPDPADIAGHLLGPINRVVLSSDCQGVTRSWLWKDRCIR